ncbi:DUF4105 domain-containing protein [Dokdonia sinensis]|uniref:DUF4105 domain-containing protein n=1 Tax=Dokdonia sinensis TaxID=2479847 RepID=A0A3M0FW37_9FLAO|nr:DUF4105 domain-containing protein [Dokdonia sinensis]RMB56894.1 DUF4105 domain-containing protein [Dokdonia sinensis]
MKKILFLLTILISGTLFCQIKLSEDASVSLLTMGPGAQLNDSFGHTAFRIKDRARGIDVVYNYGVYDFDTPNFYTKFAQGKLRYKIGRNAFQDFFENYKYQNRQITEQVFDFYPEQVQRTFDFLENNYKPENRYYLYDFFYDNCATRPVDAVYKITENDLALTYDHQSEGLTHRDLIHQFVHWNSWGSLGIDIALGSVIDRKAAPPEYLFLPEYVKNAFAKAKLENSTTTKPLVAETNDLFTPTEPIDRSPNFFLSPLMILGLLAILLFYKTTQDYKRKEVISYLDSIVLFTTGIIGIFVLLLWFATDHTATKWNYNLLWAFPFHILAAFVVAKKDPPRWIYPYMKLALIMIVLLGFHWIVGVQQYAYALLPLLVAIGIRYVFILHRLKIIRDSVTDQD